jgi:hypothetical protein
MWLLSVPAWVYADEIQETQTQPGHLLSALSMGACTSEIQKQGPHPARSPSSECSSKF